MLIFHVKRWPNSSMCHDRADSENKCVVTPATATVLIRYSTFFTLLVKYIYGCSKQSRVTESRCVINRLVRDSLSTPWLLLSLFTDERWRAFKQVAWRRDILGTNAAKDIRTCTSYASSGFATFRFSMVPVVGSCISCQLRGIRGDWLALCAVIIPAVGAGRAYTTPRWLAVVARK